MTAPLMVCAYCHQAHGFSTSCQKLLNCTEPSAAFSYPTGFCIHASVATMKKPESHEPSHTATADHQCARALSRFSPYRNSPRKADSRKKANIPSIASV